MADVVQNYPGVGHPTEERGKVNSLQTFCAVQQKFFTSAPESSSLALGGFWAVFFSQAAVCRNLGLMGHCALACMRLWYATK